MALRAHAAALHTPVAPTPSWPPLAQAGLHLPPLGFEGRAACAVLEARKVAKGILEVTRTGQTFVLTGAKLGDIDCHGVRVGRVKVGYDPHNKAALAFKKVNRLPQARQALDALFSEGRLARVAGRDMAAHALLTTSKSAYLVMPLMAGDLKPLAVMAQNDKAAALLWAMAAVLRDVRALHERNISHRNIKPANVFHRGSVASVRLADFGEAIATRRLDSTLGTPHHMSPEQAAARAGYTLYDGFAADIWGVGVSFLDLFGHNPFKTPKANRLTLHAQYARWHGGRTSRWAFFHHGKARTFAHAFDQVPESIRPLLLAMMHPDPAARPSAKHALRQVKALLPAYPLAVADATLAAVARAQCEGWGRLDAPKDPM